MTAASLALSSALQAGRRAGVGQSADVQGVTSAGTPAFATIARANPAHETAPVFTQ